MTNSPILSMIYSHDNPAELVRALPSHDLLMTLTEVGAQDCLELLELLSPEQVQDILDLEIWHNDEIDPKKAGHYFSLLLAANTDQAFAQIQGQDLELIGVIFKMVAQIYDLSEGEEPLEETSLVSLSPGGRFAVCFADEGAHKNLARSLHAFLEHLYGEDMKLALELLEGIRFEMASGLEEMSLKWRSGRLMDMGILPREERLHYFAPLTLNQLKPKEAAQAGSDISRSLIAMPHFSHERHAFLSRAINSLSPQMRAHVLQEINHAYINMFASLSGEFGDRESMREVCEYVSTLLEFGIAHQTLGKLEQAERSLAACSIKDIIRLGRTVLVALRKSLLSAKQAEGHLFGSDFCLADSPLREMARALCLTEPRFYEGLLDEAKFSIRFFKNLSDLDAVAKAINELKFRAYFIGPKVLGLTAEQLAAQPELSHASLYARFLINDFLRVENPLAGLDPSDRAKIFIAGEKLRPEFITHAKQSASALASEMAAGSNFDEKLIQIQAEHFTRAVLIQLEKNHAAFF